MRTNFVVESQAKDFYQAEEQTHLIRYAKSFRSRMVLHIIVGIVFIAGGIYALKLNGTNGVLACILLCALGVFMIWRKVSGWEVRRIVRDRKKGDQPSPPPEMDTELLRFEFDDDRCFLFGNGVQRGMLDIARLQYVQETDLIFVASTGGANGFILPKSAFVEGTPEEFREYLRSRTKRYEFIPITEKMQDLLK